MKRRVAALLFVLLALSGCGSGSGGKMDLSADEAARAIIDQVEFRDTLVKAEGGAVESRYKLTDAIEEYAIYVSGSGATAEEVAVLLVSDGKDRSDAKEIVEKRVENLKFSFENYVPEEMVKLNSPVIVERDNAVILVIADDASAAKKAVDGLFR